MAVDVGNSGLKYFLRSTCALTNRDLESSSMGNSSSSVAYALRFALVVLVCLAFGLVLGYSATPAMRWLGKRIAVAASVSDLPLVGHVGLEKRLDVQTVPQQTRAGRLEKRSSDDRSDGPRTVTPAKASSGILDEGHSLKHFTSLVDHIGRECLDVHTGQQQAKTNSRSVAPVTSSTLDEGLLFSPTLRAGPNVQDSRLGRPVQTDDLRTLSSVRTGTHSGEHWESKTHWDYCGNPQCRLCYPVAGSFASDLPDMPQGYCKRHPQSRDCKPIVVPAPKPLPKAADPPVLASAGLGAVSSQALTVLPWLLVGVLAWRNFSGRRRFRLVKRELDAWLVAGKWPDFYTASADIERLIVENGKIHRLLQDWLDKQGHDRCWYYPEIFTELAQALNLRGVKPPQLPSLAEFKAGCERYQREQYPHAVGIRDFQLDNCQIVVGKTTFRSKIRITVDTAESIVLIEPIALQELFTVALASCHGSKCVKCGAQSEGLSEPCKLTHYGVHDLGPMPMCVVKGCTAECYDPTAREGLCWQHEYPSTLKKRIERLLAAGATPKIPEAVMRDMPIWSEAIKRKHLPVIRPLSVSEGHIPEAARCDPSDLCSLHKPCAKHGGKPGAAILDEQSNSDYVGVVKEVKPPSAPTQPTNSDERGTDKT